MPVDRLDAHTVADAQRLQVALGLLRRARGHFVGELLAIDPHRMRSYSKRQMCRYRGDETSKPFKVAQTFFCLRYPKRWHVEELFNTHQALGWKRAGTTNLNIRYGQMTTGLIAQAAIHQFRQRLGEPHGSWDAKHLAHDVFKGINGTCAFAATRSPLPSTTHPTPTGSETTTRTASSRSKRPPRSHSEQSNQHPQINRCVRGLGRAPRPCGAGAVVRERVTSPSRRTAALFSPNGA